MSIFTHYPDCFDNWKKENEFDDEDIGSNNNDTNNDNNDSNNDNKKIRNENQNQNNSNSISNSNSKCSNSNGISSTGLFLTKGLTSHSGRRGAAQEADLHKDVTTTVVGHRGGWTLDSINRIFCYITMNAKGDTICARILSNWPDGTSGGFLPTIFCIDEVDRNDFRVFLLSLMASSLN